MLYVKYHNCDATLCQLNGKPDVLLGMVSVCAGCNDFRPWSALLVGATAGAAFVGWHHVILKIKIDDPLDAVAGMR